mmetsp:Transcript_104821/g.146127  ORF Transcript_104821/g.146127 Transcript_104821/m.146127 type:complete len:97 (-) Transcript_104821:170-460(-)
MMHKDALASCIHTLPKKEWDVNQQPRAKQNTAMDGRNATAVPACIHALRQDMNGSKSTWQQRDAEQEQANRICSPEVTSRFATDLLRIPHPWEQHP